MLDSKLIIHSSVSSTRPRLMLGVAVSMLTLILLISGSSLQAQQAPAKVIPINAKFRDVSTDDLSGDARSAARRRNSEARKVRNTARDAAREGISSGNMVPVKDYFNGYLFPQMTQAEELKESGSLRDLSLIHI